MQRPHFRPRFVLMVPEPVDAVRARLDQRLGAASGIEGKVRPHQVLAWIAGPERRVWSPSIDLNLRPHPDGTLVVGLVAPHPKLMTAYVFAAIGLGYLFAVACAWSVVQLTMDEAPWCLVGAAGSGLGATAVFATRALGLAWARSQMPALLALVEGFGEPRDDELDLLKAALPTSS